jgi:hypothetical protein
MLSKQEIERVRGLAKEIRELKESNYDVITWQGAIEQVVSESSENEDDYYRKVALLGYFLDEERMIQITGLSTFLESLPQQVEELKQHANGYFLAASERISLRQKIEEKIAGQEYPKNKSDAYEYYQLLIQKVFTAKTLDQLLLTLCDLSAVLREFYPNAYPDVQILANNHKEIRQLTVAQEATVTKKEIAAATGIGEAAIGLIMSRLAQLGIFEVGKKGRFNTYKYIRSTFDTNTLRKEWDWLWSLPYKKLESYE